MILPLPYVAVVAVLLGVVIVWWLSRRLEVAHAPVALMVTRIAFPQDMRLGDPDRALAML